MLERYQGSCHCGAVRFEADLDLAQPTFRCNCSICRRNRFWVAVARPEGFRLLSGAEMLTEYLFNTKKNQHFFCKRVSEERLAKVPVSYVDGLHDRWSEAPKYFSHL